MEHQEYIIEDSLQENHWWFRGRRRLLDALVSRIVGERGGKVGLILDVGCGVGANAKILKPYAERLVGIDPDKTAVEFCQNKAYDQLVRAKLEELSLTTVGVKAEIIVAMDILEHLPDDGIGASRIHDLLTDDGIAIITVPAFKFLFGIQDIVGQHYRRYGFRQLIEALDKADLEVIRWTYFNSWLFFPIATIRLLMRLWRPSAIKSENQFNNRYLNYILDKIFSLEIKSIAYGIRYPAGVSLLAVIQKKT